MGEAGGERARGGTGAAGGAGGAPRPRSPTSAPLGNKPTCACYMFVTCSHTGQGRDGPPLLQGQGVVCAAGAQGGAPPPCSARRRPLHGGRLVRRKRLLRPGLRGPTTAPPSLTSNNQHNRTHTCRCVSSSTCLLWSLMPTARHCWSRPLSRVRGCLGGTRPAQGSLPARLLAGLGSLKPAAAEQVESS